MEAPATLSVAARFALIIGGLRAAVAARIGYYAVTGAMIVYICNRLNRMNQRFQALAAAILAGKLPAERVYRRRAAAESAPVPPAPGADAAAPRDFFPIWRLVPTHRFAWLCMVAPNWAGPQYASAWGAALRSLLADPEMAALISATPRMANLLRPLCGGWGSRRRCCDRARRRRMLPSRGPIRSSRRAAGLFLAARRWQATRRRPRPAWITPGVRAFFRRRDVASRRVSISLRNNNN